MTDPDDVPGDARGDTLDETMIAARKVAQPPPADDVTLVRPRSKPAKPAVPATREETAAKPAVAAMPAVPEETAVPARRPSGDQTRMLRRREPESSAAVDSGVVRRDGTADATVPIVGSGAPVGGRAAYVPTETVDRTYGVRPAPASVPRKPLADSPPQGASQRGRPDAGAEAALARRRRRTALVVLGSLAVVVVIAIVVIVIAVVILPKH